jgi:predicted RNA-binding Zn-ribbon protein involved in translation (DUF1610 family)
MKLDKIPIKWFSVLLIILGFCVLISSFYIVIYDQDWIIIILACYAVLIVLSIILFLLKLKRPIDLDISVEEFEKTLKGSLSHFKCPSCNGIFAIKKSKLNNKKYFRMTCPDCGKVATISPNPGVVEGIIPEKKSVNVNFKCNSCGEGVTIWAEGNMLYPYIQIYSCPYCGMSNTMDHI